MIRGGDVIIVCIECVDDIKILQQAPQLLHFVHAEQSVRKPSTHL